MKKREKLVCIFAHPDDEAFGPGGTIAIFAKTHDVYLICATSGEAGKHKGKKAGKNLGAIRENEMRESAKVLGVKKVFFLGFKDGTLSNNLYHQIAAKIEIILKRLKPETILTYEPRGISGHLDHIAISMISSFVFERLKFIKKIMYFCRPEMKGGKWVYFIYVPPGYKKSEIDMIIDTSAVWETKVQAMLKHHSQIHDIDRILKRVSRLAKKEHFLIETK